MESPDLHIEQIIDEEMRMIYTPTPRGAYIIGHGDIEKTVFSKLIKEGDIWFDIDISSSFGEFHTNG